MLTLIKPGGCRGKQNRGTSLAASITPPSCSSPHSKSGVTMVHRSGRPPIRSVWKLPLIDWLMGQRGAQGAGSKITKMPAAIRKWCHYHEHRADPVTSKASPNRQEGEEMSRLDHLTLSWEKIITSKSASSQPFRSYWCENKLQIWLLRHYSSATV